MVMVMVIGLRQWQSSRTSDVMAMAMVMVMVMVPKLYGCGNGNISDIRHDGDIVVMVMVKCMHSGTTALVSRLLDAVYGCVIVIYVSVA